MCIPAQNYFLYSTTWEDKEQRKGIKRNTEEEQPKVGSGFCFHVLALLFSLIKPFLLPERAASHQPSCDLFRSFSCCGPAY